MLEKKNLKETNKEQRPTGNTKIVIEKGFVLSKIPR